MSRLMPAACALLLLALSPALRADVLLIERVEARGEVELPRRGALMAEVEAKFGAPLRKHAPVGGNLPQHPPITRWDYPQFSVYFEHTHVVNAVVNRAMPTEQGPKPVRQDP